MNSGRTQGPSRRRFLGVLGASGVLFAGCSALEETATPTETDAGTTTPTTRGTATDTATETATDEPSLDADLSWWRAPGPPGGPVTGLGISSADTERLYAGTPTTGVFHSADGGESWTQGPLRLHHARSVWASPHDADVAMTPGERTTDGGIDWEPYTVGDGHRHPRDLVFDPLDADRLYAGTGQGVARSEDGGRTWESVPMEAVWALAAATDGTRVVLWAAHSEAVSRSTDRGQSWSVVEGSRDAPEQLPFGLAVAGVDPEYGYLARNATGVYRIGGDEATVLGAELEGSTFHSRSSISVAADGTAYVVARPDQGEGWGRGQLYRYDPAADTLTAHETPREPFTVETHPTDAGTVVVGDRDGVLASTNRGRTWVDRSTGLVDGYLTTVAVNETRSRQVFTGTRCSGGLFRSEDRGETWSWERSGIDPYHDGHWGEHYLMHLTAHGDRVYATTMSGLLYSTDGGQTWTMLETDFSGERRTHLHGLAMEPGNPDVVYVGTGRLNAGGKPDAIEGTHLWKSTDGGGSWRELTNGFPTDRDSVVQQVVVSPHDPATVYVATNARDYLHGGNPPGVGLGVLKSTDAGASWRSVDIPENNVNALAIDAGDPETVYAATPTGMYRSEDGGGDWTWQMVRTVRGLVTHPTRPGVVFAGLDDGAVEVSVDGGGSFHDTGLDAGAPVPYSNRGGVWWLEFDADAGLLYAASDGGGLWRADVSDLPTG